MSKVSIVKEAAEKAIAAESGRTALLLRKAETFAAGIMIVAGFQLVEGGNLLQSSSQWVKASYCLSLVVLSVSLFFAFCGMGVKGYADYPRSNKLWDNLKPETVSEDAAQEALVQMLLKNREQNAQLNDAKVNSLFWCGWLLFVGFLLVVSGQLLDTFVNTLSS
jgi:hypothetical protein